MTLQKLSISAALAGAMLFASPVLAGLDHPALEMSVEREGVQEWFDLPSGEHQGGTQWLYDAEYESPTGWTVDYQALIDTDPFVDLAFSFTNNTGSTQMFSVSVMLPIDPITGGTVIGGSVGGSTTDASFDGAGGISAPTDGSFYNALVDGSVVRTMHDDPFSVGYDFAGDTASIPDDDFGLPGPSETGPDDALSSIGIRIDFVLSDGDSVSVSSFFVLEPVPAPGALALLGLAGLAGTRRRRRS